jgi:putative addiction module component (TIGR02574 family)
MSTKKLIDEAESLPVEERALLVDSLLQTLNQPEAEIDAEWTAVAQRRISEMRSGKVKPVAGQEVFDRIRNRFSK